MNGRAGNVAHRFRVNSRSGAWVPREATAMPMTDDCVGLKRLSADRDHYPCFRQCPGLEWYASRARKARAEPLPVIRWIGFDHGFSVLPFHARGSCTDLMWASTRSSRQGAASVSDAASPWQAPSAMYATQDKTSMT